MNKQLIGIVFIVAMVIVAFAISTNAMDEQNTLQNSSQFSYTL